MSGYTRPIAAPPTGPKLCRKHGTPKRRTTAGYDVCDECRHEAKVRWNERQQAFDDEADEYQRAIDENVD